MPILPTVLFRASLIGARAAALRSVLFAMVLACACTDTVALSDPIVYVRCARTTAELDVTGTVVLGGVSQQATRRMRGLDVYDVLPDVTHFFSGFSAPCDLVLRAGNGSEQVLYDCSSTSTDSTTCAAMDPAVSFDGQRIAFTVFRGSIVRPRENVHARVINPLAENTDTFNTTYPNRILQATQARLHTVTIASGSVQMLPHSTGDFDTGPAWLPDGRLAFTSNRDRATSTLVPGTNSSGPVSQLWISDADGGNASLASHHGLAGEQHPYVLRDGRVAYSSWQIFGARPFKYGNGTVGGFDTLGNLFHIYTQHPDGANQFAFYGQHSGDHAPSSTTGIQHLAAHFLAQTSDQRVWMAEYYRGNNNGLGAVLGVMPEPSGEEGLSPIASRPVADFYAVRDAINLATWATSNDSMSTVMPSPALSVPQYAAPLPFAGKLGHPAALPGNGLMLSWGKGACSTVSNSAVFASVGMTAPPLTSGSGQGTAMNVITSLNRDTPGCDVGLYKAGSVPLAHPNALQLIVDSRDWHEIQARAAVPYSAIHGVPAPRLIPASDKGPPHAELSNGTPYGLLGAASILDRETHPAHGIHFAGEKQLSLQGTDTINYTDDALCGVRIVGVQPNRSNLSYQQLNNLSGERVLILGEFAVRHFSPQGAALMDPSGHPDTSFLVRFPANMAYLMQGIDCQGRTLNTDQSWQSLRPGEVKTCGGCHVHSKPARVEFPQTRAAAAGFTPVSLGAGTVPLLTGGSGAQVSTRTVNGYGLQIEFNRDILPILQARCVSCHSGSEAAGHLALDRPGVAAANGNTPASTWWCLVRDRSQVCRPLEARFNTNAGPAGTTFRRPQVSRYVRAFNALGSLLYWKAAGIRTDGNTDSSFDDSSPIADRDLDFGPAHAPFVTADELGLISRWIDLGAPGGSGELSDTQKPTLTLAGVRGGAGLLGIRIGMVDVPSGIDPASLRVCLVGSNGQCGPELASGGVTHGEVPLMFASALSAPDQLIEARVRDLAGNESWLRRSVGFLLNEHVFADGFE